MTAISPVTDIIAELKAGRMVILVDDEDRENEGDLMVAADFVTPEAINFMATHARGLVCLTITGELSDRLGLSQMVPVNKSPYATAFTTSIEAARGVTTGISAHDRAATVKAATAPGAGPDDIVCPGHIFPVTARNGGVLTRAGHTEAGCDLTRLAGLTPASVICEILNEDGTMARLPQLKTFAAKHGLKIGTIADLIAHRHRTESILEQVCTKEVVTPSGVFEARVFRDTPSGGLHIALIKGDPSSSDDTLVRMHSRTSLLDWLDIGSNASRNLPLALAKIAEAKAGIAVLLNCGESPEAIASKIVPGQPAPPGTEGTSDILRGYGIGAQILRACGATGITILTQPKKLPSMAGFGLTVLGYVPF